MAVLAHPLASSGAAAKIAVISLFVQGSVFTVISITVWLLNLDRNHLRTNNATGSVVQLT